MKVIICGAGQVGFSIAQYLATEDNDIIVIDPNAEFVQRVNDNLDVLAMVGQPSYPDVLEKAGARDADMIIAVTPNDEVNMVAAQIAHSIFDIPTKIVRIRAQNYLMEHWSDLFSRDNLPIDVIISPEREVAAAISERLHVPGSFDIIPLSQKRVYAVGVHCDAKCPLLNTPLRQLSTLFPNLSVMIIAIVRGDTKIVPSGNDMILEGDNVYFIAASSQLQRAMAAFGHDEAEARKVIIAGGGNIGEFLAKALQKDYKDLRVKMIEMNRARAEKLALDLPNVTIIHGDTLDNAILDEANIKKAEAFVAVTDDDEINILSALLAKRYGCKKVVALVNNSNYEPLIYHLGIDTVVNPRAITVSKILEHVRRGRIRSVHSLGQGFGEIIEAEALATSDIVGKELRDLHLPHGALVGAIIRDNDVIMPHAGTVIKEKDVIIMFATTNVVSKIEKMLCVRLEYF